MRCAILRNNAAPAFCVTFECDIAKFRAYAKEQGLSFTIAMIFAVCKHTNEIEVFRYR